MAEAPSLEVLSLTKRYATAETPAVDGISFEIRRGECFGLLGPNGAGKSTTINCISGLYPPTSGHVRIYGHDVHARPKVARSLLGICNQDDNLDTDFRVEDQLVRHATFFRVPVAEGRARARELLGRFGLADKANELVEALSGGMRRRLQVARALMSRPQMLVLDEPTTGLDPEVRRVLWDIILECRAEKLGILLSTHYLEEAERLCDRVAIISKGKILDVDAPAALIAKYIGTELIDEEVRPGVRWRRPPNLEDVYLKLTGSRLGNGGGGEHA